MTTWVLVADASRARVFAADPVDRDLVEVADFVFTEGRLRRGDIESDRPGRFAGTGPGTHPSEAHDAFRHLTNDRFAALLAGYLDSARHEGRYDALALVAPPSLLGALRSHLPPAVAALVVYEVGKDYTRLMPRELRERISAAV